MHSHEPSITEPLSEARGLNGLRWSRHGSGQGSEVPGEDLWAGAVSSLSRPMARRNS